MPRQAKDSGVSTQARRQVRWIRGGRALPAFLAASRSRGTLGAGVSGCGTSTPSETSLS